MSIPLVDLAAQHREVADEVAAGVATVFADTAFIGGKLVEAFERAYAEATDVEHCVGVANGTEALELALRAAGVTPGGEVVLPANTFIATAEAVSRIGAVPVLVDVDPEHLLIDPAAVAGVLTPRTQAVVPVHLFGQIAPVERVLALVGPDGPVVVEDAAQSHGATRFGRSPGSWGAAAGISFYPGKNLGAAGDAGAVTTALPEVAARVRVLGSHGSSRKYVHEVVGMNSRLDALQAVVLTAKLKRLNDWNRARRAAAERYDELLADLPDVRRPGCLEGNVHVWHLYVVRVPERDGVLAALQADGIGAGVHYPYPVHLTGAYADLGYGRGDFPVAEQAAGEILSLPMFPQITAAQQARVVDRLRTALRTGRGTGRAAS